MLPLIAGMAAAGLLKNELIDKPQVRRMNEAAAEQTRWSPWTKMGAGTITQQPSSFDSALKYGTTGAMLGQQFGGAAAPMGAQGGQATAMLSQEYAQPAVNPNSPWLNYKTMNG